MGTREERLQHKKKVKRITKMRAEGSPRITVVYWPKRKTSPGWKRKKRAPRRRPLDSDRLSVLFTMWKVLGRLLEVVAEHTDSYTKPG